MVGNYRRCRASVLRTDAQVAAWYTDVYCIVSITFLSSEMRSMGAQADGGGTRSVCTGNDMNHALLYLDAKRPYSECVQRTEDWIFMHFVFDSISGGISF